jgi:ferrochelatase
MSGETSGGPRGVLLLNMGGPDTLSAVRPFLFNLFSDRLIIRLGPSFLQKPLAMLISALRAKKSRSMYALIGGGSPLKKITSEQAGALESALGADFRVYVGMRYWHPFIEDAVEKMFNDGIRSLTALSLYPHYSLATVGTTFIELKRVLDGLSIECREVKSWPDNPLYIEALSLLIQEGLGDFNGKCRHVLFSAHGLPKYFVEQGDPYVNELEKTISCLIKKIDTDIEFSLSYQSRSGPVKWLEPSTEDAIRKYSRCGVRHLLVVPISFVSDHIETLYEIDILYRELANRCGIDLRRVKALNTHPLFIEALKSLVINQSK